MIKHFGLLRLGGGPREINLLEPFRATASHDLKLDGNVWRATGSDPYIIYQLDRAANYGSLVVELDIELLEGRVQPRLYFHGRKGFKQDSSELMRRTGSGHFKLHVYLPSPCKMLRLDPAENTACTFRIRQFVIRRSTAATFAVRTMRDGSNRGEEEPKLARLITAVRRAAKNGVAFESVDGGRGSPLPGARYQRWIALSDYTADEGGAYLSRIAQLRKPPTFSVLMPVYNTPEKLLNEAIESVVNQLYGNWELCIADDASTAEWVRPTLEAWQQRDPRIMVTFREVNGHIAEATNSAFKLATGDYVALLDHDDILRPHALAEVAIALAEHPKAELLYSDEDKIEEDGQRRFDPFFKPDWNPDLFLSQNYLNHLTVHRAANIRKVGGWRKDYNGSQDYDLNLRIVSIIDPKKIVHIPKVLYHWRLTSTSMAQDEGTKSYAVDNAIKALQSFLNKRRIKGKVEQIPETNWYRIKYALPDPAPLVSLIIPTRNGYKILKSCIDSIIEKTVYPRYEIIIVDNGSDDPETIAYFEQLKKQRKARVLSYPHAFNYSAINNFAVSKAKGSVIGLVNNDIEVITPEWLNEMVGLALRSGTGCVGAKLYYPNNTIQHAGVIVGLGGVAGHSHKYFDRVARGYFGRLKVIHNVTAVTAACLVIRKDIYSKVGGLDAVNLKVAFNDVDFCMKVSEAGYLNVWTPFAELYHHESITRGTEDDPVKQERFASEIRYMKEKWGAALASDRLYSPNLTLKYEDYSINVD